MPPRRSRVDSNRNETTASNHPSHLRMQPLPELEHLLSLAFAGADPGHPAGVSLPSYFQRAATRGRRRSELDAELLFPAELQRRLGPSAGQAIADRKSTRLNSSHANISYAVFCLEKT